MKVLMGILTVLVVATGKPAAQPYGYLFPFADENHSCWCVEGEGIYRFEAWLWCLPGDDGSIGAAFSMGFPSNVIEDTLIVNDAVVSDLIGDLEKGIMVELQNCQYDWFWMLRQVFYATDSEKSRIFVTSHPLRSTALIKTCSEGNPYKSCCACRLFVNYTMADAECQTYDPWYPVCDCPSTDTKSASWGAIKALIE